MKRSGAKRKWRGTTPGRPNMHRLSDDELAAQQPHRRDLPPDKRNSEKAATTLGRLNLNGYITDEQFTAGDRYLGVVNEFLCMAGGPRDSFAPGKGYRCLGETGCEPCECKDREERYLAAEYILKDCGQLARLVVRHVAVDDQDCPPYQRGTLRMGLSALARHFGLTARSNFVTGRNVT